MISEINIIRLFLYNEEFRQRVHCHLSSKLFNNTYVGELFDLINTYYAKHSKMPINNIKMLIYNNPLKQEKEVIEEKIRIVDVDNNYYAELEIDETLDDMEKWLHTQNLFCYLQSGINAWEKTVNDSDKPINFSELKKQLNEIEKINFDENLDAIDVSNSKLMFEIHNHVEMQLKFNNHLLNKITNGGCTIPSLNLVAGAPNAGKTRFLCSIAADYLMAGIDVLYVSLEMSDKKIAKLIDYMLIEQNKYDVKNMTYEQYSEISNKMKEKQGRLQVKLFPKIDINNIKNFVYRLENIGFEPKVIIIDYLGLMKSENKKEFQEWITVKLVSEEVRAYAIEKDLIIWSGAQFNRTGSMKKDGADMSDMADSFGINRTADLILAAIDNEELQKQNKQLFKIIKDREGLKGHYLFAEIPKNKYCVNFVDFSDTYETVSEQGTYDTSDINKKFKNNSDINNTKYTIGVGVIK